MSNILIHMLVNPHSEYDIFSPTNYADMSCVFRQQEICCPNLGNRLWFQGLVSEISGKENTLSYFHEGMSKDYINESFDMIVAPMANVFHVAFSDLLLRLADRFRGIRIPVYVIACGVQADGYDSLDTLCAAIKEPAQAFMRSVYDTGGEFALRGYFSKEFFDRMGFSSAVVTGCPSLYQLGRNLRISNNKVSEKSFRPLVNGNANKYIAMAEHYPHAEFFDQERFFHILHDQYQTLNLRTMVHNYGYQPTQWLLSEQIKMIPNMNDWWNYLQDSGFHFSFGSRIHGSIMPILAGIPAAMTPQDSRTREMAEFFDIPTVDAEDKSLYEIYLETDYSAFNAAFAQKYDAYEKFLISHGIAARCSSQNLFLSRCTVDVTAGNHQKLEAMNCTMQHQKWLWKGYDSILQRKRNLLRKG